MATPRRIAEPPWWYDAKSVMFVALAATFCLLLLLIGVSWILIGPERVPVKARDHFVDVLKVLLGLFTGYMIGRTNGRTPPAPPASAPPQPS